jgi:4-amino-4-deoxy-L-arabinose transferase-like glycosyltransferase
MTERNVLWLRRLGDAALIAAVLAVCADAYQGLLVRLPPVHADEAGHALPAARMALALAHGHFGAFLAATRNEVMWPFFHPWVIVPAFLVCGISTAIARTSSLISFGAALCIVPAFARELARQSDDTAGVSVMDAPHVTLGWLSVAVLIGAAQWQLMCTVMSESLGMALTLLTLLVDAHAARRHRLALHVASGLLAALTFFTKYNYGLPLMAALLIAGMWRLHHRQARRTLATLVAMALPVALWLAWQLYPDLSRGRELVAAIVNRDEGLRGLADVLFYPRTLLEWLGWPTALVALAALAVGFARAVRDRRLTSVLFALFALAMLTLHPNKQVRYVLMVFPVLLVLAETELSARMTWCPWQSAVWIGAALTLVLVRDPLAAIRVQAEDAARLRDAQPILDFVSDQVAPGQRVLCLGTTGRLPHLALSWRLLERDGREPEVDLLPFPDEVEGDRRYRSGYPTEMRSGYDVLLRQALSGGRYARVVALQLGEESPFLPDWQAKWDKWAQNYVARMPSQAGWDLRSQRVFPGSAASVRVYAPRTSASGDSSPLDMTAGQRR